MRKTGGRHEIKHQISFFDLMELKARLPTIAKRDENAGENNSYRVKSLYFDNYADKALKEKVDGVDGREKFRLRLYNNNTDFIRLEKKAKDGGLCFKENEVITKAECERLLAGEISVLKENGKPLCMELYTKMQTQVLRPKNTVDYEREAFVFSAGNVRITLDYDIRATSNTAQFLDSERVMLPITGYSILEVKYDCFLPELIRGMVALKSRRQQAFSKYAAARMI